MNLLPSVNDRRHVTAAFDMLLDYFLRFQVFMFWSLTS